MQAGLGQPKFQSIGTGPGPGHPEVAGGGFDAQNQHILVVVQAQQQPITGFGVESYRC